MITLCPWHHCPLSPPASRRNILVLFYYNKCWEAWTNSTRASIVKLTVLKWFVRIQPHDSAEFKRLILYKNISHIIHPAVKWVLEWNHHYSSETLNMNYFWIIGLDLLGQISYFTHTSFGSHSRYITTFYKTIYKYYLTFSRFCEAYFYFTIFFLHTVPTVWTFGNTFLYIIFDTIYFKILHILIITYIKLYVYIIFFILNATESKWCIVYTHTQKL